jgi:serine/threonine-protein kinase
MMRRTMSEFDDTLQSGHTGRQIGKFRLERRLGQGAMGEVFLGVHVELGNAVAVKILTRQASAEANGVERFLNEARAVAAIDHENVARIIDQDRLPDGTPYIVMEYVDGQTLRDVLQEQGALPLRQAVELGLDVLAALTAAHGRGVVHRDLKPENIRVTPTGRAKVLDFGIAKRLDAPSTALTAEGAVVGTPHYMSPEQVSGLVIDGRTDLYALGVILFECVTGQRPFEADQLVQLLHRQLTVAPVPPSSLRGDLPGSLERVILRALEKSAALRFVDAKEMAQALRATLAELPTGPTLAQVRAAAPQVELATPGEAFAATTVRAPVAVAPVAPSPSAPGPSRALWFATVLVAVAAVSFGVASVLARGAVALPSPAVVDAGLSVAHVEPPAVVPAPVPVVAAPVPPTPVGEPTKGPRVPSKRPLPPVVLAPPVPVAVPTQQPPAPLPVVPAPVKRDVNQLQTFPVDFDVKNFDAVGYLAQAQRLARTLMSDAVLIDFSVRGVFPDGHVDLSLAPGYEAEYYFRSPSLSVEDPSVPDDDEEIRCLTYVIVSAHKVQLYSAVSRYACKEKVRPRITCTLPQAAQASLSQGGKPTVAKASWLQDGWFFDYGEDVVSVKCR